ncbi:MAG: S8 family serine peptidase [Anaerolineae bacterium]|nr:S8 family serine peptidase [Anaerolineae bacterium]
MKRLSLVMLAVIISLMTLLSSSPRPSNAQNPTATPNPAATEEVDVQPLDPTITPTTPALKPPTNGGQPPFKAPKSLDELRATYPDLGPFIDKYKDAKVGDIDMAELYEKITTIFNSEGASGVGTFLVDSGLLDKLNIPLSYIDLLTAYDEGGLEAVDKLARDRQIINKRDELAGYLMLDAETSVPDETTRLQALGVSVYRYNVTTDELEIGIPLAILAQFQTPGKLLAYLSSVSDSDHVEGFRPPHAGSGIDGLTLGAVKGIGAQVIGADKWHEAGITGKGVKVGILDIGFGGIKELLGDSLPEEVTSNLDLDELDAQEESHGTAVAEVVHSIAPDAELVLAYFDQTSFDSVLDALQFLQDNEVQVLNHSFGGVLGPRDGQWGMAAMFNQFVRDTGVLMVQSAGNSRLSHTMFKFNPGQKDLHLFGKTDSGDEVYALPIEARTTNVAVIANWNGNWDGKEKSQYNVIVLNKDGEEVGVGNEPRRGKKADYPFQIAEFEAEKGEVYYVLFQHARGDSDNVLDVFIQGGYVAEWAQVQAYSVVSPGDADALLTVGAVGLEGDEQEPYSSEGPTTDDRMKPDITAPTGEQTGAYPKGFFGTSGSAPMISGAAALVLQANPKMSYSELKAYLMENIVDLGDEGEDTKFGTGRLMLPAPDGSSDDNTKGDDGSDKDKGDDKGDKGDDRGSKGSSEPAVATVTDVNAKFGVKVGKQTGLQITTSFDLENFEGDKLIVGALFLDKDGNSLPSADPNYEVSGTIAAATEVEPSSGETSFEDITMFIPNAVFKKVTVKEAYIIIVIVDPSKEGSDSLIGKSNPIKVKITKK